ncbi:MAG: glycerophosphodiester phosphodiesterase family protein [Flavobacteriaceae bacterium]
MKHLGVLVFFVAVLKASCGFAQQEEAKTKNNGMPEKGICAHRGAKETHPENTLSAFKEAIRLGAQMIEFDVQLSKDGELVIMHDSSVDRTTNGTGQVSELTLAELQLLDAGAWKSSEFKGEKIPTLKETLQGMPKNIWLNIHLKGNEALGRKTAELVLAENRAHQAIIACEKEAATGVRSVSPSLLICNMERLASRQEYLMETIEKNYPFIQLKKSRDDISFQEDIQTLKKHKIKINYVQADAPEEIGILLALGIDFILTDHLAVMLEAFAEANPSEIKN